MRHNATQHHPRCNHWAVGWTGEKLPGLADSCVLAQLQEAGNQARVVLTPEEAEAMAEQLLHFAKKARATNQAGEGVAQS